jgi:hypothetical protein
MITRVLALAVVFLAACGGPVEPRPEPPRDCHAPIAFPGESPNTIRVLQLSAMGEQSQAIRVELQPRDGGHVLYVHPTTAQDVWGDAGSIAFMDASGEVIYSEADLCVTDFSEFAWEIPDDAVSVLLNLPISPPTATLLITVEISAL